MKALILQLSDIHIRHNTDLVLTRVDKIVDAVKNLEAGLDQLVCLVSGDIAYSGSEEEYLIAYEFFDTLTASIRSKLKPLNCRYVVIPGNHDCDFSDTSAIRDSILPNVKSKPELLTEQSHLEICTQPLKKYFEFATVLPLLELVPNEAGASHLLVNEYKHTINDETITFLCYNTAILSTLHEQPGTLLFPTDLIPSSRSNDSAVISVFHHPSHWLEPNCGREFRKRIEAVSDIIFTGHEHTQDRRHVSSTHGDATYVEGGCPSGKWKLSK